MTINLKGLSRKDLEKLRADVEKALGALAKKERDEAIAAAEKAAGKFGFSLAELTGAPKKRKGGAGASKSPAKYRNPENPAQTWSGRGRKPQWIHDALARGSDLSDCEI